MHGQQNIRTETVGRKWLSKPEPIIGLALYKKRRLWHNNRYCLNYGGQAEGHHTGCPTAVVAAVPASGSGVAQLLDYGLGNPGTEVRISGVSTPALGLTQSSVQWFVGAFYSGIRRLGREANRSSPSGVRRLRIRVTAHPLVHVPQLFLFVVCISLRHCATRRKVAGSIPDGVVGNFLIDLILPAPPWRRVDSASKRNEYQEYFLGGKGGRCVRLIILPPLCADCFEIWEPQPVGKLRAYPGL